MNNDEKIKELLEAEEIPEEISPENIKAMLDAQAARTVSDEAAQKKRSGIRIGGRIAAAAAACALIAGGGAALKNSDILRNHKKGFGIDTTSEYNEPKSKGEGQQNDDIDGSVKTEGSADTKGYGSKEGTKVSSESYMSGASSYKEIYTLYEKSSKKYERQLKKNSRKYSLNAAVESVADEEVKEAPMAVEDSAMINGEDGQTLGIGGGDEQTEAFSDTFEQEEGVKEADIIKTDGKNIYTLFNYYDYNDENEDYFFFGNNQKAYLNIAPVDKGDIGDVTHICISDNIGNVFGEQYSQAVTAQDMYLYNDLIAVVGTAYSSPIFSSNGERFYYLYGAKNTVFVSFYTCTDTPEYLGTYFQDGCYNDVRITPDGFMYLISDYSTESFNSIEDPENIDRYIPACGTDKNGRSCIDPGCILLPGDGLPEEYCLRYSVIGSIDLSNPGTYSVCDTKALAGFAGTIYCTPDNIYTANGYDKTEITRIAIGGGKIEPAASCKLTGYVLDQFSMSEYNGYFRIATSENRWISIGNTFTDMIGWTDDELVRNNHVYVLDMDLNTIGSISDFGLDENIKSVNFSGNIAYVVTYEQTDPLFAIDLSNPAQPTIMDELKLPGFSTYMQKWDDGHLIGFGINADEGGVQTGIKAVMFDNSDPYDLKEVGFYAVDRHNDTWIWSGATYEHKALLIAPEKNLFGFPVTIHGYLPNTYDPYYTSKYVFLSYDGTQFVQRGELAEDMNDDAYCSEFERALYIGDYIYAVSGNKIIAATIDDITVTDTAVLNPFNS